uniref:Genome polyprotein n=1 Tax=Pacific island silvergrassseco-like virus TaxID=3115816 RepID=A0AAT9JAT0_9SECO
MSQSINQTNQQLESVSFQNEYPPFSMDTIVLQATIPPPSDLALFQRYGSDDLSSNPRAGTVQRVERIRADVRFIEERVARMAPIVEAIRSTQTANPTTPPPTTQTPTPSTGAGANFNPTGPGSGSSAVNQHAEMNTTRPAGTGGFPDTLEGMLARIIFNLRRSMETQGLEFQATISNRDWTDWNDGNRIPAAITSNDPRTNVERVEFFPLIFPCAGPHRGSSTTVGIIRFVGGQLAVAFRNGNGDMMFANIASWGPTNQAHAPFAPANFIPFSTTGVAPPTNPTPGQVAGSMTDRVDAINRNIRQLMEHMGSSPVVIAQASLDNVLKIADVDQVLEPPSQQILADTPMEEQISTIDKWTVDNILSRPTLIGRAIWAAQGANTELIGASFPNQWLNNLGSNTHFVNLLNAYSMMKADVVFRVVVNSTSMYGGHIALGFDFFSRLHDLARSRNDAGLDLTTVSNTDPIYLDISEGTTIELKVPFSAVSQYLSRQHAPFSASHMGSVFVHTMSTLYRPANAPDVEVRLFAYVQKPQVAVLQVPELGDYVVPQATIVKTITSFAHSFLPSMKEVYPLAMEDGFHVERQSTCRVEDIGGVYGLIRSVQWSTSTPEGTALTSFNVHPMTHIMVPGATAPNPIDPTQPDIVTRRTRRMVPRLGHLGRHYSYWNGTLDYKIVVSCSKSHAGKFYVIFESGPSFQGAPNQIEPNAHILFDVQQQHSLEFSMPFASPTPWKPTYIANPFGDISRTCTGTIRLISADGIKSALTPDSNITVNVYMKAGADFQYAVPRNGLQGALNLSQTLAQVELTSLSTRRRQNHEDFNDIYKILRRYSPLGRPIDATGSQQIVIPVRPVIPGFLGQNSISTVSAGFSFWKGSVSYKFKVLSNTVNRAAFEVFHVPTMGIPADMNNNYFRLFPRNASSDLSGTGSFFGSQTFHAEIDKEWEVTVPYYSMYDHLHIPLVHHTGSGDVTRKLPLLSTNNGCIVVRPLQTINDTLRTNFQLAVSMSCGSDFTLLAPTSYPPILTQDNSAIGTNFTVVAQASLEANAEDQGLYDMYKDLQNILTKLSSLSDTLNTDVDENSTEYFSTIIETTILRLIARAKLSLSGWVAQMLPDVDWRLLASSFVGCALLYFLRDQLTSTVGRLILGALATTVSHKVLSSLMQYVQDVMNPPIRVQVGTGLDVTTITQLCCGVIAVLLNMDFRKGVSGFVKNIGELGKSLSGINSGVAAVKVFSEFVSANIVPSLSESDALTLRSLMIDSVNILDEVHTLNLEEMRVACHTQKEMKDRVLKCDGRLQELYRLTLLNPCSPGIVNALRAAMTKMDKLRTEVMSYKGESGYRIDPFHISVYGSPGIGKSAMMTQLNEDLIAFHGLPTTNKVYTRSPENVYWDNYKGQTTTIFDDLGQIAAANPPSDLSELISLKSNAPYMVHMASIAEKGTYFTSTFLISSTNFKLYNDCTFVKEKAALHRRRNILVEMRPTTWIEAHDQDNLPPVDFNAGLFGETPYAKYRILNSLTAEVESDWMTYDAFTALCCRRSEAYLQQQNELVRRNQTVARASPSIQAIIAEREQLNNIPGVGIDGEFQPNAEAQGYLDFLRSTGREEDAARADELKRTWYQNFLNAEYWRDYGALTASFSDVDRFELAAAIREKDPKNLNKFQRVVYNIWFKSVALQKLSAAALERSRDQIALVGRYFHGLYEKVPSDRRKYLASALVALGAVGVGYTLYATYSNAGKDMQTSNIPLEAFAEGDESYQSKQRSQPPSKRVIVESGIDDYKTKHGQRPKIVLESGIDDYKTRRGVRSKIVLESTLEADPKWIIPEDVEEKKATWPQLFGELAHALAIRAASFAAGYYGTQAAFYLAHQANNYYTAYRWMFTNNGYRDFLMFAQQICIMQGYRPEGSISDDQPCVDFLRSLQTYLQKVLDDEATEEDHAQAAQTFSSVRAYFKKHNIDLLVQPESGIDDYKTRHGKARKIILEGSISKNPMMLDVPDEVLTLSEEDMIAYLSSDSAPPSKELKTVETTMAAYSVVELEPQYSTDIECSQFLRTKLLDNMGMILHVKSGYRMRCLAVDDCYIVLPKHFFLLGEANWQEGDLFKYVIRGKVYEQDFHAPRLLTKPNRDLAMYMVSSRISGARSVMNQIASVTDHSNYRTTDGELVSLAREKDGSTYINRHYLPVINRMTESEKDKTVYRVGATVHRLVGYTYSASTLNGDCGSLLLQHNVRCPGKIIGFHVAAQTGYAKAFSELLVREELEMMRETLRKSTGYITSGSVIQTVDTAVSKGLIVQGSINHRFQYMNPNVTILGKVPSALQKRTPTKTEIKPSPLQGVIDIEPLTEPAILDPRDPRCTSGQDPLIKTVGDYGLGSKPFPTVHLNLITEHQVQKLRKYDGYINKRVLSLKEAINGIPGVDYADAMNMKSAEGSFWNLSRPFWAHNKSWMFINTAPEGEVPEYKIDVESGLLHKLVHRLKEAREGRRVLSTSFECLKDERRGHKKTRPKPDATEEEKANFTPGTRSFSILPIDYNILVRQYFWDFAAMIMKHRNELGPQVGIDPCSIEWTGLMMRLLATSKLGFAGDYSNYDRQTPAEFMDVACDIINGWYDDGPQNAQIRKVLMGEAYDRLTIVRDAFVHIDKGLPSGFPLTVIVNSLNNDTYKYCAWLALAPSHLITLDKADELVDSVYYGDDNDHAIAAEAQPFFNLCTVGKFLEEHGVSLTDEHKNHWSVAPPLVEVESTSFLKRLFVPHKRSRFYLAPLEKKSIEDRLLWVTDSKFMSDDELLFENIRNSLRDAFHWGEGYFNDLKNKIDDAIAIKYPDPEMRRRMMCNVTYGGEEYKWIQTCKGLDQLSQDPILRDVFGY